MKKRVFAVLLGSVLAMGALVGCGGGASSDAPADDQQGTEGEAPAETEGETVKIKVGASPAPHAEILQEAKAG